MRPRLHRIIILAAALLAACASSPLPTPALPSLVSADGSVPALDLLLLGEQHDAPVHQSLHRQTIEALAARDALAALALEMAEQDAATTGLPRDASEASVQAALRWSEPAWPWAVYRDAVMAAVRAGVPVIGVNLPRARMRASMSDTTLDQLLNGPAFMAQQEAIRQGHCGLLPESQIVPMTRIQIDRDRTMARSLAQAALPGKVLVLLAGGRHVDPELGVPRHLPPRIRFQAVQWPPQPTGIDYCADLKRRVAPGAAR